MASPSQVILLTGAPASAILDHYNEGGLVDTFDVVFKRYLGLAYEEPTPPQSSTVRVSRWRRVEVPDDSAVLARPVSQPVSQFPGFWNTGLSQRAEDAREDFLEHSTMVMDDLLENEGDSSRCTELDGETTMLSLDSNGSFLETSDDRIDQADADLCGAAPIDQSIASDIVISNLSNIPTAAVLQRLQPQTVTVNLLVAVIKMEPTRTVRLRKRNVDMEIVELIVGDESRAGFGISFWLVPEDSHRPEADGTRRMRQQLRAVQTGQIVCLRNVALATFRQCVYGQSLNRRAVNVHTTVEMCTHDRALAPLHRPKYRSVCAWRDAFVGPVIIDANTLSRGEVARKRKRAQEMPPDTQ